MPSRERVNWARFRVFAVALVAFAILATLVYLVTGGTLLQEKATLYLYIPDATGLGPAAPVRVDGIGVGTVKSVGLSGSNDAKRVVKVTISVERARLASIPADSYAELSSDTMIGDQFVDITSGRSPNSIRPDSELTYKEAGTMKSLDLRQFDKQLKEVDALLTDLEQGKSRVGQFVLGEEVYDSLKKRVGQMLGDIREATSRNTAIGQALYTDDLYRQISQPLVELDRTLAKFGSGQGSAGQFLTDPAQYEQIRAGIQDFEKTVRELHASEFIQKDRAYEQWNRSLASLIQSVDDLNADPLLVTSATYDNLNGAARSLRDGLRDLRTDPRKALRLVF
jgi:phospholipid/cholesterol/gamma-HCH transport system substrate-binding protein